MFESCRDRQFDKLRQFFRRISNQISLLSFRPISGGILFGLSVSSAFGLDVWLGGFFGRIFALVCGAVGSLLMPRFFDIFVIAASAVSGAAMVLIGANHILPGVQLIDPAAGGALPSLITIIVAAAGIGWQRHNTAKWVQVLATAFQSLQWWSESRGPRWTESIVICDPGKNRNTIRQL